MLKQEVFKKENEYQVLLDQQIRNCLWNGPKQLIDIIRNCEGAYPTLVRERVRALAPEINSVSVSAYTLPVNVNGNEFTELSKLTEVEGNPVLCSWYYTSGTCQRIAALRNWTGLRLAFLGTPRLYECFRQQNLGKERLLLDLDAVVINKLTSAYEGKSDQILHYDVANEIPECVNKGYHCVFFDPPWYPEDYPLWLQRAVEIAPDGQAFFSLFPELTRPTAKEERKMILSQAGRFLNGVTSLQSFVEYNIPTYERAELEASGIFHLATWKLADFIVARLNTWIAPQKELMIGSHSQWAEVDIDSLRIFVDMKERFLEASSLLSTAEGNSLILSSPSRRNPQLRKINVLTSRGHGLLASDPNKFLQILQIIRKAKQSSGHIEPILEELALDCTSLELIKKLFAGDLKCLTNFCFDSET